EVRTDMKGNPKMKMLFLQDKEGGPLIELIENPNAPVCSGVTIAFHVEDLEEHHTLLTEKGYSPKPIISPVPTVKFFFMTDPNGVSIQFM
ncbi:MAG: VOC family protein, partial [Oscillospiraceae bacterium]|nr:VOC family protein [Oscillospiraceae bacterium]